MGSITQGISSLLNTAKDLSVECNVYFSIPNFPEVKVGDRLESLVLKSLLPVTEVQDGDIFIIASKIVSKAEGMVIELSKVNPSKKAIELSTITGKPASTCQVILNQSVSYIMNGRTIIAHHKKGYQLTSAGVDKLDENFVTVIPEDPDKSAKRIMKSIKEKTGKDVAVIIIDSEGRKDRAGAGSVALGVAGIDPIRIRSYTNDSGIIKETQETLSDLIAGGASVIIGQRGKGTPVVCLRGFDFEFNPEAKLLTFIDNNRS